MAVSFLDLPNEVILEIAGLLVSKSLERRWSTLNLRPVPQAGTPAPHIQTYECPSIAYAV